MHGHEQLFRYIGTGAIALLLLGLGGWYFFISRQTAGIEDASTSRGFSIGVPSFGGSRGSTAENVALGFGTGAEFEATPQEGEKMRPPRLWKISTTPVAGMGFIASGSTTILRFVERSTGHIFDANLEDGIVTRRTNTLMPRTYEAVVGREVIILRQLDENGVVTTFSGAVGTTTAEDGSSPLEGASLGGGMRNITLNGSSLIFTADDANGTNLVRAEIDGSDAEAIHALGVHVNIVALPDGRIVLAEAPASGVSGSAYEIESDGGLTPLARNTLGLTILPRASSSALLIGSDTGSALALSVRPADNASLLPLSIKTIAHKCVWAPGLSLTAYCAVPEAPGVNFLDNWYRGKVHTTDSWFKIEAGAGTAEVFFETNSNIALDIENPTIDESGNYLVFMNARDKSLWALRILE